MNLKNVFESDSKIGLVVGSFPRLTETFLYRQAKYLGAEVLTNNYLTENQGLYDLSSLQVTKLGVERNCISYRLFSIFKSLYLRITGVPFLYWHPKEIRDLNKRLSTQDIDGLLVSYGGHGIAIMEMCKKHKVPLIVEFLGTDASRSLNYPNYVDKLQELFDYASYIVVLNDWMRKDFEDLGCSPKKIRKINIGVPVGEIPFYPMIKLKTFNFIGVGRFTSKKAPVNTIKAFELCANKNVNVRLTMIGGGPLDDEVRNYVANSKFKSRIELPGYLKQEQLRELYKECHVFVQHSVRAESGDCEGWPVGMAEACCYGRPIISTKHAGIVDQVVHGQTGYLVDENDIKSMGDYMLQISNDFELCTQMGLKSRKHVEENGDVVKQVGKIMSLFHSISRN